MSDNDSGPTKLWAYHLKHQLCASLHLPRKDMSPAIDLGDDAQNVFPVGGSERKIWCSLAGVSTNLLNLSFQWAEDHMGMVLLMS